LNKEYNRLPFWTLNEAGLSQDAHYRINEETAIGILPDRELYLEQYW